MRRHVIGFAVCVLVGIAVYCIAALLGAVLDLPHEVLADSRGLVDVRRMLVAALAFATLCTGMRAIVRRRQATA